MMAMSEAAPQGDGPEGFMRRKRNKGGGWIALGVLAVIVLGIVWLVLTREEQTTLRVSSDKTVKVVLPPPPPPPPPPEVKPQETPPEPKPVPMETPVDDTPPPPDSAPSDSSDATVGDSALTAREGAGPSNYGLARGDGSGTRIGGRPGGNTFGAYAASVQNEIRAAAQRHPELSRQKFTVQVALTVSEDGRITGVRLVQSTGDARKDAAVIAALTGLQLSRRPPPELPSMRMELRGA